MSSTPLVDVHAHFLTDDYVDTAIAAGIEHPDGMPQWPSWSAEQHLSLMQDNGIRHALLSLSSPGVSFAGATDAPALARHVNDFAARTVAAQGRSAPGRSRVQSHSLRQRLLLDTGVCRGPTGRRP
ncbi:hypothetical protein [Mycolicibacterium porcinum]|uniref:hypothetical protein n=1 Tax=Mycolicibacterium porcinum TaxID=39693 RepID=UPI000AEE7DF5|nr:hypothetical protein [Mycolicibacterium porcinum]